MVGASFTVSLDMEPFGRGYVCLNIPLGPSIWLHGRKASIRELLEKALDDLRDEDPEPKHDPAELGEVVA